MSDMEIAGIYIVILCVMLAFGAPVGASLCLVGAAGLITLTGSISSPLDLIATSALSVVSTYSYIVVPMFIMMGLLATATGISTKLYDAAFKNLNWLPGGLAIATNWACAGFSAVSGSSISTVITFAKIAMPEMEKRKYSPLLSTGAIASASALLIPPSTMLTIYAIFAEQSIGKLLIAGILPGLLVAVSNTAVIMAMVGLNPKLAPRGETFTFRERARSLLNLLPFGTLFLVVLLGIIFGIWTPTEAASVAVVIVLVIGFVTRTIRRSTLMAAIYESIVSTAAIFVVLIGSLLFGKFLVVSGVTEEFASLITSWNLSQFQFILVIVALYLVLGTFLEGMSMLALTSALVLPLVEQQGLSLIWFGVVFTLLVEIANLSPPVGLNLYAMKGAAPHIPLGTIMKGSTPFWLGMIVVVFILYFFPQIVLWLPGVMIGR